MPTTAAATGPLYSDDIPFDAEDPSAEGSIASIDASAQGVSSGAGVLTSMLSWLGGALRRGEAMLAGVRSAPAYDPKLERPERFDAVALHDTLVKYRARYARQLSGAGLLLKTGREVPPCAFEALESSGRFGVVPTGPSFTVRDHPSMQAACQAMVLGINGQWDGAPSAQVAWLVNATLVRAALTMTPFLKSPPRVEFAGGACQLHFRHDGETASVPVKELSSPLSLHREARFAIEGLWSVRLFSAAEEVRGEFMAALKAQGIPPDKLMEMTLPLIQAVGAHKTMMRLRHSSAAFIDIRAIADTCAQVVQALDREAIRNALRHGNVGLSWRSFNAHLDPALKREIAAAEPHGALAYAHYQPSVLLTLSRLLTDPKAILTNDWNSGLSPVHDEGLIAAFSSCMARSLRDHLEPASAAALARLSPRYLSVLILGVDERDTVATLFWRHHPSATPAEMDETAGRAGRRLACALNACLANENPTSMPWSRVVSCPTAYELLLSDEPDERAIKGLETLVRCANSMRSRGHKLSEGLRLLPSAQELMDAPASDPVGSLLNLYGTVSGKGWAAAGRSALLLVRDFARECGDVRTRASNEGGGATEIRWQPKLGAVWRPPLNMENDHCAGFRLGWRIPGRRVGGWAVMDVVARTGSSQSNEDAQRLETNSYSLQIRGAGTPEKVEGLVLELHIPENARFQSVMDRPERSDKYLALGLQDISGCGIASGHMRVPQGKQARPAAPDGAQEHVNNLMASVAARMADAMARHPFDAAGLMPAVARYLWSGGKLADNQVLRPLGTAAAFRLARASVGADNPHGVGLACRYARRADARSSSGVSLLDLALESSDLQAAQGALEGLRKNGELAKSPERLAALVQASIGKLIERHPKLIPLAMECGVRGDEAFMRAWEALHPKRRTAEMEAQIHLARMREHIDATAACAARPADGAEIVDATPRRRARAV